MPTGVAAFATGLPIGLKPWPFSQSASCSATLKRHNVKARPRTPLMMAKSEHPRGDDTFGEGSDWIEGLEAMFEEALLSFYEGAPLFSEAEFQTLRDELQHLGSSSIRLAAMEKVWVMAAQERDLDRRVRRELELSEDDLAMMKTSLLTRAKRRISESKNKSPKAPPSLKTPTSKQPMRDMFAPQSAKSFGLSDAEVVDSSARVDERLRWLLFGDATEERLKIVLLYLPAVLMSFITATFFTILFALLDGEMRITVTQVGRVRLGIMTYVVVASTFWFSNKVTPASLEFLDLGQPQLMRGQCPNCQSSVSCLFTGGHRVRDGMLLVSSRRVFRAP